MYENPYVIYHNVVFKHICRTEYYCTFESWLLVHLLMSWQAGIGKEWVFNGSARFWTRRRSDTSRDNHVATKSHPSCILRGGKS